MLQIWRLQPEVQKEASGVLRELRKLAQPTIAFHVRGGDLTSAADEQLFSDVSARPPLHFHTLYTTALSFPDA